MDTISIIVPCYNEEATLSYFWQEMRRTADGMSAANDLDFEFLFVDDGSADQTLALLRQFSKQDSAIVSSEKPLDIVLEVISDDTIALSASLLGFQLAGVSILLSLGSNSKLETLRDISSDSMVYKIFLSSVSMFLLSIMLMIAVLNLFKNLPLSPRSLQVKSIIGYASVASFAFGMIFLFSSIRLLKWCCSQ